MGGTLDGDGLHWLERFGSTYASAGVDLPRDLLRAAFDAAERRAARDDDIAGASLESMVDRHLGWQLAHLDEAGRPLHERRADLVRAFTGSIRDVAARNVPLLAALKSRGLALGVVSNGCGNVDLLCRDLGYAPFLSIVVDSRRVGLYKPDPAIFACAAARLGVAHASIMMVGDSFERDILPARSIGMRTAWLQGPPDRRCPDPSRVDVCLPTLADLPEAIGLREWTVA